MGPFGFGQFGEKGEKENKKKRIYGNIMMFHSIPPALY